MKQSEQNQFFANKSGTPHKVRVGGKLSFSKFPVELQKKIKEKLAESDPVMKRGLSGELPGLKINGKQVTRENIHEFEIDKMSDKKPKVKKEKLEEIVEEEFTKQKEVKYTKSQLNELTFSELREIGDKLNIKFRGKKEAVREILAEQK